MSVGHTDFLSTGNSHCIVLNARDSLVYSENHQSSVWVEWCIPKRHSERLVWEEQHPSCRRCWSFIFLLSLIFLHSTYYLLSLYYKCICVLLLVCLSHWNVNFMKVGTSYCSISISAASGSVAWNIGNAQQIFIEWKVQEETENCSWNVLNVIFRKKCQNWCGMRVKLSNESERIS